MEHTSIIIIIIVMLSIVWWVCSYKTANELDYPAQKTAFLLAWSEFGITAKLENKFILRPKSFFGDKDKVYLPKSLVCLPQRKLFAYLLYDSSAFNSINIVDSY